MSETPRPVVIVRPAEERDLEAIVAIEEACFALPWPASVLREDILENRIALYLVAELEGQVAAYLGGWFYDIEFHVGSVATAPQFRRRGLGELLMLLVLQRVPLCGTELALLEYRISNTAAGGLYNKLGFEKVRIRRRYYTDNDEDAVEAMIADLPSAPVQRRLGNFLARWRQKYDYELQITEFGR
ncbi:MAG TPA: ribosomal protein S18-alanine N-acetyltransferase [Armatimonadota bacterium]|jgi:ribosomal-protein-alanine N-acetyltransferase